MTGARRALAALLSATLVSGCASTPKSGYSGRTVTVVTDVNGAKVQGELLVVEKDRLWVRAEDGVREIPLNGVRDVSVKRHRLGMSAALGWVAAGAAVSAIGMASACARVEDDCGGVGLTFAGVWLLLGTPAALSLAGSSRIEYSRPTADTLRPFARLPQGLPPGLTPAALGPSPAGPPAKKKD